MELFHIIDDVQVIIRSRGVFRQVSLYKRGKDFFAKYGGGFVRLMDRGYTSVPNISWIDIDEFKELDIKR